MAKMHKHAIGMVFLFFLAIGWASPAQAQTEAQGEGYWIPNDKAEEAAELLKQGKSVEELGIESFQKANKEDNFQTLNELRNDQQSAATYETYLDPPKLTEQGWTPPEFNYDHITSTEECRNHPSSSSETGYIKNRYSFCWSHVATFIWAGHAVQFQFTEIGYGSNQSRKMRIYYQIDDIIVTHPSLNGVKLKVDFDCTPKLNPTDCKVDSSTPAVERPIAQWKNQNFGTKIFYSEAPEATETNPDQLGFMEFWPKLTITHKPAKFTKTIDGISQTVRFDSAKYMFAFPNTYFPHGAVFSEAIPVLKVPVTKPEFEVLREAGEHWKFAMENPEQTRPYVLGKKIPGAVGDRPLTRMYTKRHEEEYQKNRNYTRTICNREFQNEDRTGKECDEFPFASTWEGSAMNGLDWFSVRLISKESNGAAGAWLGAWYAYDRILDGDRFYVNVEAPEKVASIRSDGNPLPGQDNRSSENFTIDNIPPYATRLEWRIVDGPANATFDVMKDNRFWVDETIFYDLGHGSITEIQTGDHFYIARPKNTDGNPFTVEVYAIP